MCLPYIYVWNLSNPKTTDKHSLSMLGYCVSTSVRVLEVKAMGLWFCKSAAPKPYSLASVCIVRGWFLS